MKAGRRGGILWVTRDNTAAPRTWWRLAGSYICAPLG